MRLILFILFSLNLSNSIAQIDLRNRTPKRTDSSFILTEVLNIIAVTNAQSAGWQLRASHAQITPTDSPWLFKAETNRLGADTFYLLRNGKTVLTKIFWVIPIHYAVAHWGALKSDTASTAEVIANRRMVVSLPDCNHCLAFRVFGYEMSFISDQFAAHNKIIKTNSDLLTQEAVDIISKLNHGDKIVFAHILEEAHDARIRELPGFTIVIR